jgi:sialidase-1
MFSKYLFTHNANNPRSSEGSLVRLNDGRLFFLYSKYLPSKRGGSDHGLAVIAKIYSSDNGQNWTDPITVFKNPNKRSRNVMSVSLLWLDKEHKMLGCLYIVKNSKKDLYPYWRISEDQGETWNDPIQVIKTGGYSVVNNDRVILTTKGRLMIPAAFVKKSGKGPYVAIVHYSDDLGKTWEQIPKPIKIGGVGAQEPGLVELKNGDIRMFVRTNFGLIYTSVSEDHGVNWGPLIPTQLASPVSPISCKRVPLKNNPLLAIWNHNGVNSDRTPLTSALSYDEGESWTSIKNIEPSPDHGYCYTSIYFDDIERKEGHMVYLTYCGGLQKTRLFDLKFMKIPLEWFSK